MKYITEINEFYDWLETNPLSDSAINLWHALMHVANKSGWKQEFAVAISTLELKTSLSKSSIQRARNALQQSGRLTFKSRPGQMSAVYRMLAIHSDPQSDPQNDTLPVAGHTDPQTVPQTVPQSAPQTVPQTVPITRLDYTETREDSHSLERAPAIAPPLPDYLKPFAKAAQAEARVRSEQFETFWAAYAKAVDRIECEVEWYRLTEEERSAALAAVDRYVQSTPELRWRKNPNNWLAAKAWLNEIPAASKPNAAQGAPVTIKKKML